MNNSIQKVKPLKDSQSDAADASGSSEKAGWETPTMEDVSEQVMAQPYIRFT